MKTPLADMEHIARVILDHELADLRAQAQAAADRRAAVKALSQAQARRGETLAAERAESDLALLMGRDVIWQDWVRRERASRQARLAQALAEQEAQRLRARHAFGRTEALRALRLRDDAERQVISRRRSGLDGPS